MKSLMKVCFTEGQKQGSIKSYVNFAIAKRTELCLISQLSGLGSHRGRECSNKSQIAHFSLLCLIMLKAPVAVGVSSSLSL